MLATADDVDGLPGHVSGFAQSTLFIFMFGVQLALSIQEWAFYGSTAYVETVYMERYTFELCKLDVSTDNNFLIYKLSYAILLLVLQICINPFIVKSERNYKEGLLFCISSIILGIIWVGWISMYMVMGKEYDRSWNDKSVCCGLLACGSTLIIFIFLPKVILAYYNFLSHTLNTCEF